MSRPLIELHDVSRIYDLGHVQVAALQNVDLQVQQGEFVAIVGPSGSGKSTMMNILGCLDRPTGGTYILAGTPVAELDDDGLARLRSRTIGFVFQSLQPAAADLGARERRDAPPLPGRLAQGARWPGRRVALERLGLGDRLDHDPDRAVRRPAAARRDRPGARHRTGPAPGRRADRQPRQHLGRRRDGAPRTSSTPRAGRS